MMLKTAMERLEEQAQWGGQGARPLSEGLEGLLIELAHGSALGLERALRESRAAREAAMEEDSLPLRLAALSGEWEMVKALAPYSDIKAGESLALRAAALSGGSAEMALWLLPESDPLAAGAGALASACSEGNEALARALAPVSGELGRSGAGALLASRHEMALPLLEGLEEGAGSGSARLAAELARKWGKSRLADRMELWADGQEERAALDHEINAEPREERASKTKPLSL